MSSACACTASCAGFLLAEEKGKPASLAALRGEDDSAGDTTDEEEVNDDETPVCSEGRLGVSGRT